MGTKELVSVIVPVYNSQDYLMECVTSLINQSYPYVQIILVDDGSDDSSGHLCDQLANDHQNIIAEHIVNSGVSHARNVGLNLASGNYLMFVDSDDLLHHDAIINSVKLLKESNSDAVSFGIKRFLRLADFACSFVGKTKIAYSSHDILFSMLNNDSVGGYVCNKIFRRDVIGNIRFDESLACCEDFEFCTRAASQCRSMVMTDQVFYYYRQTNSSITNDLKYTERISTIIDAYEKIIPIYRKFCPEQVAQLTRNYLKQNLNLLGRLRLSKNFDKVTETRFLSNIDKTFAYAMGANDISLVEKFNIKLTKAFPACSLRVKQQILKLIRFIRK